MWKRKKKEEEEQAPAAYTLWGDLLPEIQSEILSRVPYRSLCRFKCVSTTWLALCSDPAVRRRSPQTLSGFFCYPQFEGLSFLYPQFEGLSFLNQRDEGLSFLNLSGRGRPLVDPSLPFLGDDYEGVMLLNCCGGILLCQGRNRTLEILEYFVCNPATEKIWAVLPPPDVPEPSPYNFYLGFDPAVPSRFVVFKFIQEGHGIVRVYSSDTGEWTSTASGRHIVQYVGETLCAFFNDALHFTAYDKGDDKFYPEWESIPSIFTVNADGDTWRRFPVPSEVCFSFIGQSQGRLYGINIDNVKDCMLSVWDLKDYASGHWTLKHTASILKLLGRPYCELGEQYLVAAVHPECNLIFLVGWMRSQKTLMSYDMDSQKLHVICTLDDYQMTKLRPYIPCFAEWPPSEAH